MPRTKSPGELLAPDDVPKALQTALRKARKQPDGLTRITLQLAEIDDQIATAQAHLARLQEQRVTLSEQAQRYSPASERAGAYREVLNVFTAGLVPVDQQLECAAMLIHGDDTPAYHFALRAGREYLLSSAGDPFVAIGHAFIATHGLWCGGKLAGTPHISVAGNTFCITIPVSVGGSAQHCHLPIKHLARMTDTAFFCGTDFFIGDKRIPAGIIAALQGLSGTHSEAHRRYANAALADAGYNSSQRTALFKRIDRIV